jgi:hypothetical protein
MTTIAEITAAVTVPGRTCGSCTKCCEGWLAGEVNGRRFYPGMPCHYKGQGCCTIYDQRPKQQCQDFHCQWLLDDRLAAWFRPDSVDVLLVKIQTDAYAYIKAYETGSKIDATVLNSLLQWAMQYDINLSYQVGGGWNAIGSPAFVADHSVIYDSSGARSLSIA